MRDRCCSIHIRRLARPFGVGALDTEIMSRSNSLFKSLDVVLQNGGGILRTTTLHNRGFTQYILREALRSGRIVRPQRGWVALPNADPHLLFAARHGVVLSCITQAARLGLWVLNKDMIHVCGSLTSRSTTAAECVVHWRKPLIPRRPDQLADGIENVLNVVAACQSHDSALAIWDSALQKGLIDYQSLASLPLPGRARSLLEESTPYSDSGIETLFRTRLRWLRVPIRTQVWLFGHRVDFLIGERLVVQIDGKQHAGAQRVSDMEHDAELMRRGYHVIRVGYAQIVHEWEKVEGWICQAIARNLHLAPR